MSPRDHNPAEADSLRRRVTELEAALALASVNFEGYLRSVFDDLFEGIQILDFDLRYIYLNKTAARHGRFPREELVGRRMSEVYPGIEQTELYTLLRSCLKERVPRHLVNSFMYPDGRSAWFDLRISPVPMGIVVLSVDISDQKEVADQLQRSREDLATTLECMAEAVITTDLTGRVVRMNPAAEALSGWPEQEARGRPFGELVQFLNQQTQCPVDHPVERALETGLELGLAQPTLLVARDGSRVPVALSGAPIRDGQAQVRGAVLVLKNMKEEYELTAMLQRAQKMEALGTLAGGIAHDFNNLLTVIAGYTSLLLDDLPAANPVRDSVEEIRKAGDRAAALTRQLLAFSRQQVLEPRVIDLNSIVRDTEGMLRRIIGEDISLHAALDPRLGRIRSDPGQIEQVILNLAVNARDAMPQGGKLTIETANIELDESYVHSHIDVPLGRHVMLAISDTGCGMDEATRARIFEPFFTTKGPGKGTGLGLATVFGIVKQSGGHIWVYSEPGQGTVFKIYLPVVDQDPAPRRPPAAPTAPGGTETILLVEDDETVRRVTVSSLRRFGYSVLAAANGFEAVALCQAHAGPIHLLVCDVVMPEMSGGRAADAVLALRPQIKILYLSGYTDDAVVRHGILNQEVAFLQKPFTAGSLARKVREVLGA